jgi:hypothetical protein
MVRPIDERGQVPVRQNFFARLSPRAAARQGRCLDDL